MEQENSRSGQRALYTKAFHKLTSAVRLRNVYCLDRIALLYSDLNIEPVGEGQQSDGCIELKVSGIPFEVTEDEYGLRFKCLENDFWHNYLYLAKSQKLEFVYTIRDNKLTDADIEQINQIDDVDYIRHRVEMIEQKGCRLAFERERQSAKILMNNLTMLDSEMPRIAADMLLIKARTGVSDTVELTNLLSKLNPLDYPNPELFYEVKVRRMLEGFAHRVKGSMPWNGRWRVDGYFDACTQEGLIYAILYYKRNLIGDFLYNRTEFLWLKNCSKPNESANKKRFGIVQRADDGTLTFNLNLRIGYK